MAVFALDLRELQDLREPLEELRLLGNGGIKTGDELAQESGIRITDRSDDIPETSGTGITSQVRAAYGVALAAVGQGVSRSFAHSDDHDFAVTALFPIEEFRLCIQGMAAWLAAGIEDTPGIIRTVGGRFKHPHPLSGVDLQGLGGNRFRDRISADYVRDEVREAG